MELAQHSLVFVQHLENISLNHSGLSLVAMDIAVAAKGFRRNKYDKKNTHL